MQDQELSDLLQRGDFGSLFRRMGWDNPEQRLPVDMAEGAWRPVAVADKRGVTAWRVDCPNGLPSRSEQHRVVRHLKRLSRDQLVVFAAPDRHLWQWPEQRPSGVEYRLVDHEYPVEAPTDALLQRLSQATFKVEEEAQLTSSAVLTRVRRSFNADKVTKSFYREFQRHHKNFATRVEGIPVGKNRRWYASVLLNRLMFIYFIQQKGFLDNNQNYLRRRLEMVREHYGADQFYAFYKQFLLPLFHEGLGSPEPSYADAGIKTIIGNVPYVNGGIFERHDLEKTHDIQIKDQAFESLFDFFDAWRWHLDENPTGDPKEINPDILGFIFEQYINFTEAGQKDKGAYYTKPDVTGYMAASTILPALTDRFVAAGLDDPCILLSGSGDTYIHDSILHGVDQPLPEGLGTGSQPPSDELALPGERWCDVTHRRDRCSRLRELLSDSNREWSIDDAITENLDMRELLGDYLIQLSTADECDTAFGVLRSLTVCDPTVGSGAFLFAALEILDPLYEAVLGRAAELHDKHGDNELADCLAEARKHPSERYWMLKTLCLNNLYGVDLMDEAPEIAKLRLFLKLAAQIDDVSLVEPLPDLDFNIKTGNLLVGIADEEDAARRLSEGRFDFGGEIGDIERVAEQVADAYDTFVSEQSSDLGILDHATAKQKLSAQLEAARSLASTLLHSLRRESTKNTFDEWCDSHRPFHWFVEFPSVWRTGGFDVIVGNPPYIRDDSLRAVKRQYSWRGYETNDLPDLFAPCVERASTLLNEIGRFSMIVVYSVCYSADYKQLRDFMSTKYASLWASSFDRTSDSLFSGSAKVRNTILVGSRQGIRSICTSRCRGWLVALRPHLFSLVSYISPPYEMLARPGNLWPFIDDEHVADVFQQLLRGGKAIDESLLPSRRVSEVRLGYRASAYSMVAVWLDEPPALNPQGLPASLEKNKWLHFSTDDIERDIAYLILAGRWGYIWWLIYGNARDVTKGVLASFPVNLADVASSRFADSLQDVASRLSSESLSHISWNMRGPVGGQWKVGNYNLRSPECRAITDEGDWLLAQVWGLRQQQFDAAGNLRDRMVFGS